MKVTRRARSRGTQTSHMERFGISASPPGPISAGDRILFSDTDRQWRKGVVLSIKAGRIRIHSNDGREFTKIRFEVTPDRDLA